MMRDWFRRLRRDDGVDEELQAHLAMAVRDRIERGETKEEAELAARRELGNRTLIAEDVREVWAWGIWEDVWRDVRYALRVMGRSKGVTTAAVASLALGIGANTAIFSLFYTVMLRSLPVERPEELVELLQKYPGEPRGNGFWSLASYEHYRDRNHVFSALTGTAIDSQTRVEVEGAEALVTVSENVIGNYFSLLGVRPAMGRWIGPEDRDGVAVISWGLWNSRFHGDPEVLGKRLLVKDKPVTVVGVAPRWFTGLLVNLQTDVWLPVNPKAGLALVGRLKQGVTLQQARAEMETLFRFTIEERAAGFKDPQIWKLKVEVEPAGGGFSRVRDRVGQPLVALLGIVGVLLVLACLNVAGLLLARGAARAKEMALRLGLGASRGRLLRQMLTESLLLSALGTAVGALVAYFGTAALLRIMDSGREHEQLHLQVRMDGVVLAFAAGVAVLSGLLFGLAPAVSLLRGTPASPLRQSGRAVETPWQRWFGKGLVSAQVALSFLLLSAGGLFVGHVWHLKSADLGFQRDHVLLVSVDSSRSGLRGEPLARMYRELLERVQRMPGVRSAAVGGPTPLQGAGASGFVLVDGFAEREQDRRWTRIAYVGPRYFETLQTPLMAGRDFSFQDTAMDPQPAIVSHSLAQYYFPGRSAVGQRIRLENVTLTRGVVTYEIVGVVGDANYGEIREELRRTVFLPSFRANRVITGALLIRTASAPGSLMGDVRRLVREMGQNLEVRRMITLEDQVDASILMERMMGTLAAFFAGLGALLAGIGVYGLLAYAVTRRTNEIGIRLALGATPAGVLRMVVSESVGIVVAGVLVGIPMMVWGRSVAAALVTDLTVNPSAVVALGAAGMIVVALAASYVPARRAASVNPMECLRHE
ncbi:MAG: ABC transporter permease [Bryobacteraceae bacterium]